MPDNLDKTTDGVKIFNKYCFVYGQCRLTCWIHFCGQTNGNGEVMQRYMSWRSISRRSYA